MFSNLNKKYHIYFDNYQNVNKLNSSLPTSLSISSFHDNNDIDDLIKCFSLIFLLSGKKPKIVTKNFKYYRQDLPKKTPIKVKLTVRKANLLPFLSQINFLFLESSKNYEFLGYQSFGESCIKFLILNSFSFPELQRYYSFFLSKQKLKITLRSKSISKNLFFSQILK